MRSVVLQLLTKLVQRELRAGSDVVWDSVRSSVYAPFLVSTCLLLGGYLDADHWTWITAATVAADTTRRSITSSVTELTHALRRWSSWNNVDVDDD